MDNEKKRENLCQFYHLMFPFGCIDSKKREINHIRIYKHFIFPQYVRDFVFFSFCYLM